LRDTPPRTISAVQVVLVPPNGTPGAAKAVPAGELGARSTCLAKLKSIELGQLIKEALLEGEYSLAISDDAGGRRLTLHNSEDLSESGGAYFSSDCAYTLVQGLMGSANGDVQP